MQRKRTDRMVWPGALALLVSLAWTGAAAAQEHGAAVVQRATERAVAQSVDALEEGRSLPLESIAVLPLEGDEDGYATEIVRSALANSPYRLITRDDETWDQLLAEIEWGVRRQDVMDPETVQKFGRIQGVQGIMTGRIWDRGTDMQGVRGRAKLVLNISEVETGHQIWSSGPVSAEAFIDSREAASEYWLVGLVLLAALAGMLALMMFWRALKRANRPL